MTTVYNPHTLAELVDALNKTTENSKIVSGGTDLVIKLHHKNIDPDALVNLSNIAEIKNIEVKNQCCLYIGAGCTFNQIAASDAIPANMQALKDAASDIGSPQIRGLGTIGGNIANASPAGDMLPILFMLDAQIGIITNEGNTKEKPIAEVVLGPGKTCLCHQVAIVYVRIPLVDAQYQTAFTKLGFRNKVTIARIGMAAMFSGNPAQIADLKIYMGAIAPVPVEAQAAAVCFKGQALSEAVEIKAYQALQELIMQHTPEEFDRAYKLKAVRGVVADMAEIIAKRLS